MRRTAIKTATSDGSSRVTAVECRVRPGLVTTKHKTMSSLTNVLGRNTEPPIRTPTAIEFVPDARLTT